MNKSFALYCFCFGFTLSCIASVVEPPQPVYLNRFAGGLEIAESEGRDIALSKWSDIEKLPFELQVRMLGTHVQDRPNVSDHFSIIPLSERSKFPYGSLLIMSAAPFDLTAWLRDWYAKDRAYTKEQIEAYDSAHPKSEVIRWYLIKDGEGKYRHASITEDELTKICKQTGLIIPKPEVYRFNMSQVDPATGRPINAPASPLIPAVTSDDEKGSPSSVTVSTPNLQPDTEPAKLLNPLWRIVCLVMLAAVALFVTHKKKPKA